MNMKVTLMRHGQTEWNKERRLQGRIDIPLSNEGRLQALKASEKMPLIDLCLTSPLLRACETARLVLQNQQTPIIKEDLLIEQCFGALEGRRIVWDRVSADDPLYSFKFDPEHYTPSDGGENFNDLSLRAKRFIHECVLPLADTKQHLLICAHGAILCALINEWYGIPLSSFWSSLLGNCCMRTIELRDGKPVNS